MAQVKAVGVTYCRLISFPPWWAQRWHGSEPDTHSFDLALYLHYEVCMNHSGAWWSICSGCVPKGRSWGMTGYADLTCVFSVIGRGCPLKGLLRKKNAWSAWYSHFMLPKYVAPEGLVSDIDWHMDSLVAFVSHVTPRHYETQPSSPFSSLSK